MLLPGGGNDLCSLGSGIGVWLMSLAQDLSFC